MLFFIIIPLSPTWCKREMLMQTPLHGLHLFLFILSLVTCVSCQKVCWTYQAVSVRHNTTEFCMEVSGLNLGWNIIRPNWKICMVALCPSRWMLETNHEIVHNSCLSNPFSFTIHSLLWYCITSVFDTSSLTNLHSNQLRWTCCKYWIFCGLPLSNISQSLDLFCLYRLLFFSFKCCKGFYTCCWMLLFNCSTFSLPHALFKTCLECLSCCNPVFSVL